MYDITDYFEAKTIDEAITYLKNNNDALIISGGTDILIKSRDGEEKYNNIKLVGITRIPELKEIKEVNGDIYIGAASTFTEIENNPIINQKIKILASAVGTVGGPQVRNAGTIGGNICNGVTSADSASTIFVLNAILVLKGVNGTREVSIHDFYKGVAKVDKEHDEILLYIKILKENYEGYVGHYIKFAQRNAMDIATLGCSALIKMNGNKIDDLKLGYGVAGPVPLRGTIAEEFAKGLEINEENLNQIGIKALENSKARDSWRGSKAYRESLIVELTGRAIKIALGGDQ